MAEQATIDDPVVAELPWLRALARRLGADEADDLVQDTWLLARRDRPVPRSAGGLRAWLRCAMRNRLVSVRRSSVSRERREKGSLHHASVEPEQYAIDADLARVIDDALATLNAPDRALLRERFFSGRNASEIAAELGVPAATVRTRIRRSLLRLREVLSERHGRDRTRWALALAAVPSPRSILGGISMGSVKVFVAAGVVAGVVALGWTLVDDRSPSPANAAMSEETETFDVSKAPSATARAAMPPAPSEDPQPPIARRGVLPLAKDASEDRTHECATNAAKHDCDFLEPSDVVLDEMARCGIVRYDFPAMFAQHDWAPEFEAQWLDVVGATPGERERIIQIGDACRDELFADLEALAKEVGVGQWPTDATLLTAVIDISKAVGDDNVAEASRRLAQERAGHADPPETLEGLPAAERFVRLFTAVGDTFEAKLAAQLGEARARELHLAQDGWPGLRHQTGARCSG